MVPHPLQTISTALAGTYPYRVMADPYPRRVTCAYCDRTRDEKDGQCQSCGAWKVKERK